MKNLTVHLISWFKIFNSLLSSSVYVLKCNNGVYMCTGKPKSTCGNCNLSLYYFFYSSRTYIWLSLPWKWGELSAGHTWSQACVVCLFATLLKPGSHMSGKSQTVWNFSFSWPYTSQILTTRLVKTWNHRYPSLIIWDEREQIWKIGRVSVSLHVPDFRDGQRSFLTNENPNLYCWGCRGPSAMDFDHYQSHYHKWANTLGWLAKSKIPDCLGFSRHTCMKTRLKDLLSFNILRWIYGVWECYCMPFCVDFYHLMMTTLSSCIN